MDRLYEHTRIPFELILVSQGSEPPTVEWLNLLRKDRPNFHVILNDRNVGTAVGRNRGILAAQGEYVVVVDNDVEFTEQWLEPLLETARNDESVACVGAMILTPQGRPQYCSHYTVERQQADGLRSIGLRFDRWFAADSPEIGAECDVPWYPTTCLLIRKEAFDRVGGFDERLFLAEEDKDLCLALRNSGYRVVFNPRSRVVHNGYPRDPGYAKLRENLPLLHRDKRYFEQKWSCGVINESSRTYLLQSGISEERLQQYEKFPLFMKVVP